MTDPTMGSSGHGRHGAEPPIPGDVPRVPNGPEPAQPGGALPPQAMRPTGAPPPAPGGAEPYGTVNNPGAQPPAVPPGTAYPQESTYSAAQREPQPGWSGGGSQGREGAQGTAQAATDEGKRVAGEAQESAKRVTGAAKDEGRKVTGEVKDQARAVYDQARTEVSQQASVQQGRLAEGLIDAGSELDEMSSATDRNGLATTLVSEAAARTTDLGRWLQNREPEDVLDEVKRFARRRPVTFVAVAAVAGIVVGRLTRGLVEDAKDDGATP